MARIVVALLALWLIVTLLGAVRKGLMWLMVIGIILFAVTAAWGWMKRNTTRV